MGSTQSKRNKKHSLTTKQLANIPDHSDVIGQPINHFKFLNQHQLLANNQKHQTSRQLLLRQKARHEEDQSSPVYHQQYREPAYQKPLGAAYFNAQSYQNLYRSSSVSPFDVDEEDQEEEGEKDDDFVERYGEEDEHEEVSEEAASETSRSFLNHPIYLPPDLQNQQLINRSDVGILRDQPFSSRAKVSRLFQRQSLYSSQPHDLYAVSKPSSRPIQVAAAVALETHGKKRSGPRDFYKIQQDNHARISESKLGVRRKRLHSSQIIESPYAEASLATPYTTTEQQYYETASRVRRVAPHYSQHPSTGLFRQLAAKPSYNSNANARRKAQQSEQLIERLPRASRHNNHLSGAVEGVKGEGLAAQRSNGEQTNKRKPVGAYSSNSSASQYSSQSSASTFPVQVAPQNLSKFPETNQTPSNSANQSVAAKEQQNKSTAHQKVESISSNNPATSMHSSSSQEKGLAFTAHERQKFRLNGLPAAHQNQDLQIRAVLNYVDKCAKDELAAYVYLRNLKDYNERLFYAALSENVERLMPLVYTPTVGLGCQKFSEIYMRPRGLFVNVQQKGKITQVLEEWPEKDVRVIVVTDGERILGLGDLGANGMGISIGKLSLYTALAGIPPKNVLPITLDVGTNNQKFLDDPFYIGLKQARIRGEAYDSFIDEFMRAVVARWGRTCLIQFEDFANSNAFTLLQRYRDYYCTFNDDIQGTASVCLSGLISAARQAGKRLADSTFLFYGAGEANLGTANLLIMAMQEEGASREQAQKRVWLVDSKGLLVSDRTDLSSHKRALAQPGPQIAQLEPIIQHVKPQAIIGASAQSGAFTESICKLMASINERPIIFALSNPTSKAECTAQQAYEWTEGRCVFASGSPFEPVQYAGKRYVTGQGNNAYIFPAVGLAAIAAHTHSIPEEVFLVAARALSDQVQASDAAQGLVYPSLSRIGEVTLTLATRVLEYFYTERLATYRPEPNDKLSFLRGIQYDYHYPASD